MPTNRRPSSMQAWPVVPDPEKGSTTKSLRFEAHAMMGLNRASGSCVGKSGRRSLHVPVRRGIGSGFIPQTSSHSLPSGLARLSLYTSWRSLARVTASGLNTKCFGSFTNQSNAREHRLNLPVQFTPKDSYHVSH